jgi:hypothetical protein
MPPQDKHLPEFVKREAEKTHPRRVSIRFGLAPGRE